MLTCHIDKSAPFFRFPLSLSKEEHQYHRQKGEGGVEDQESYKRPNRLAGKPLEGNFSCLLVELERANSQTNCQRVNSKYEMLICF